MYLSLSFSLYLYKYLQLSLQKCRFIKLKRRQFHKNRSTINFARSHSHKFGAIETEI